MKTWLNIRSLLLFITLLTSGVSALAQRTPPLPGQWIGDLYLFDQILFEDSVRDATKKYVLIDDDNNVIPIHPEIKIPIDFQVPKEYGSFAPYFYWHNEALYNMASPRILEENGDGSRFQRYNFLKWQDGEWHFLGEYKHLTNARNGSWLRFIPCDNDRFIVICGVNDLTGNTGPERTPFFRMSISAGKKELNLDSPIDHGMDDLREHMSKFNFFRQVANCSFAVTDKHAFLINPLTGLYWVFSLERASLIRAGKVFNKVTPEVIAKGGYLDAILTVNPEREGTFLFTTQEEGALVTEIGSTFEEIVKLMTENPDITEEGAMKVLKERQEELAKRNPNMIWYRIHPDSGGRLEKLETPPIGAAYVRDGGKNDDWRPLSDGSVRMGPITFNAKREAKEAENGTDDGKKDETMNK